MLSVTVHKLDKHSTKQVEEQKSEEKHIIKIKVEDITESEGEGVDAENDSKKSTKCADSEKK